jgi:hypothetical protein
MFQSTNHHQTQEPLFPIATFLHLGLCILVSTLLHAPQFQCSPILGAAAGMGATIGNVAISAPGAVIGAAIGGTAGAVVGGIKKVTGTAKEGTSYTTSGLMAGATAGVGVTGLTGLGDVGSVVGAAGGACVGVALEAGKACKNGWKKAAKKLKDHQAEKKAEKAKQEAKQQGPARQASVASKKTK